MVLEPSIAERAAGLADEHGLAELSVSLEAMTTAVEQIERGGPTDVIGFVGLDREFHEILAKIAGNRVLALAHESVTSLFIPAGQVILPRLKDLSPRARCTSIYFRVPAYAGCRRCAQVDAQTHGRLPPRLRDDGDVDGFASRCGQSVEPSVSYAETVKLLLL